MIYSRACSKIPLEKLDDRKYSHNPNPMDSARSASSSPVEPEILLTYLDTYLNHVCVRKQLSTLL